MAQRQRSPFGELVYAHRTARNLTRAQLASRMANLGNLGGPSGSVSVRTIADIEQRYEPGLAWTTNHQATVDLLAGMLDIEPGSAEWLAFHEAAAATRAASGHLPLDSQTLARVSRNATHPFVEAGRQVQLERMLSAVDSVAAGIPEVLLVAGELGSGKTTLITHACQTAVERHPGLVVLWGSSTVDPSPYQVSIQCMNVALMQFEHTSPVQMVSEQNLQNLQRRLPRALHTIANDGQALIERLVPVATLDSFRDQSEFAPYLTTLDPIAMAPSDEQEFLEQTWRTLATYCLGGPVVIVFENLHLADEGTASIFHHFARRLSESSLPVLLIGSYRPFDLVPTLSHTSPPFATVSREIQHYFLDPMVNLDAAVGGTAGQDYVNELVRTQVQDAPPTLAGEIFALTEGLPFFVEAVLRWYLAEGAMLPTPALDTLRWNHTPVSLPEEITTVLADLYRYLDDDSRAILDTASVQGITFSADVLQQVMGISRIDLIERLVSTLTRQLHVLQQAGVRTIADRQSYDYQFVHAMMGEFVYQHLPADHKARLHRQTARAMQELWGDDMHNGAIHIARQYDMAGDARAAGIWYLRAGDHHLVRHEYRQAVPHYEQVRDLNLLEVEPFLAAQSLVGLGNCARGMGDLAQARAHLTAARDVARDHHVPLVKANALTSLGMVLFDAGDMEAGATSLQRAVEILKDAGDLAEACRASSLLGYLLHAQGRYDEATRCANEAIAMAQVLGRDDLYVRGLLSLADSRLSLGFHTEVVDLTERARRIAGELDDTSQIVIAGINLSHALIELGAFDRAQAAIDRVFALRHVTNPRMVAATHFHQGLAGLLQGDMNQAQEHFATTHALREENQQQALLVDAATGLLQVALARNDLESIRQWAPWLRDRLASQGANGAEHPARAFLVLAQAGEVLNDDALVTWSLETGAALLHQRASMLESPDDRRSYFEQVSANRDLLAAVAATHGQAPRIVHGS